MYGPRAITGSLRIGAIVGTTLGLLSLSAEAQDLFEDISGPYRVWQGGVTLTSVAKPCGEAASVGDLVTGVFRPRMKGREPSSALSLVFSRSAAILTNTDGSESDNMHGAGQYVATHIDENAAVSDQYEGKYAFSLDPADPGRKTLFIQIDGTIKRHLNISGCTIKFLGAFAQRP